jgi:DNA-binding MarR family transcriptional regulator
MDHLELSSSLRDVISKLHKRLRKQSYSGDGLSMTELTTLSHLYLSPPLSPSELADLNKIKTQSMSQVLARLESAKLIQRMASSEDKRKVGVSLTPQGKKMIEQSRYERDEWLAEAIRNTLSEKESKTLSAAIPLLRQIADVD